MTPARFSSWLSVGKRGLYCKPGDFRIDPHTAVPKALVTHGHSDHARPGHDHVLATEETLAIMDARLGTAAVSRTQAATYGEPIRIGDVTVTFVPAGHPRQRANPDRTKVGAIISGDYKRSADPTCLPFELTKWISSSRRRRLDCPCSSMAARARKWPSS